MRRIEDGRAAHIRMSGAQPPGHDAFAAMCESCTRIVARVRPPAAK
jgi:hypothetical protein